MSPFPRHVAAGLLATALALGCGGGGGEPLTIAATPFQSEVIVRSARNLQNHAAVLSLVAGAQAGHVGTVVVAAKQDEDDEFPSGTVFYPSAIAPQAYPGFDAFQDLLTEAHRAGIKVKAWLPQFHDRVAAQKNPAWAMQALVNGVVSAYTGRPAGSAYFVNPCSAAVQAYEQSIVQEFLNGYAVDGLVLDWIRFDDWNMDLSVGTRAAFQAATGQPDPLTLNLLTDNAARQAWQAWRTDQIADHVRAIRALVDARRPGLPLGIFILPPEFVEVGQDAAKFRGLVDFVSPMCYWADWGYPASWIDATVLVDTVAKVGPGVAVIPAFGIKNTSSEYHSVNAGIRAAFPAIGTVGFFGYLTWTPPDFAAVDSWRR